MKELVSYDLFNDCQIGIRLLGQLNMWMEENWSVLLLTKATFDILCYSLSKHEIYKQQTGLRNEV